MYDARTDTRSNTHLIIFAVLYEGYLSIQIVHLRGRWYCSLGQDVCMRDIRQKPYSEAGRICCISERETEQRWDDVYRQRIND
jgi:hypothetical protein